MSYFSSFFLSKDKYNFKFPLLLSSLYNLVHFVLAVISIWITQGTRIPRQQLDSPIPYLLGDKKDPFLDNTSDEYIPPRIHSSSRTIIQRMFDYLEDIGAFNLWIIVCSLISAVDIGFSGYSLRNIPLAFYMILKSGTPVFILLFKFFFQPEKPTIQPTAIVFTIAIGIGLVSYGNAEILKASYIILVIASSIMSGFKLAFLKYFINQSVLRNNSVLESLCVMSFLLGIFLFFGFLCFEGLFNLIDQESLKQPGDTIKCFSLIIAAGIISFFECIAEYIVLSKTSVITISIMRIAKEILIVGISIASKEMKLSSINQLGLAIAVLGILLFGYKETIFEQIPAPEKSPEKQKTEAPANPVDQIPLKAAIA
ncbi:solute carrier family 35, member C2 [Nematocida sp. AWRm80]|nr:solute carrier family 35, member C2 [Nematocida sp. AWRm80]